jgi:Ion channel
MISKRVFRHVSGFWSEERNLSVLLGLIVFNLFVLPSLTWLPGGGRGLQLLNYLAFVLLLLTGVISLTTHKGVQLTFSAIAVLIVLVRSGRLIFWYAWLIGWDIFLTLISFVAFAVVVLGHVFKEGPMTGRRIQGAVAAYLLLAMAFSLAYLLIEFLSPSSFQLHGRALQLDEESWKIFNYFSICTLTTLGYGDITPIQPLARNLVIIEALVGQLYPAILLARLVSLHTQTPRPKKDG